MRGPALPTLPAPSSMAYLLFALICLLFGSNFILMDRANQWFGPMEIGLGRLLGAAIFLGLCWLLFERRRRFHWSSLPAVFLIAIVCNAYPYIAQPALIHQASLINENCGHSFFGMTVAFTPLLTILVSLPMLGVRPTARQLVGVIGGLGFIGLLMFDGSLRGLTPSMLAIAITVPLSYALGNTWLGRRFSDADSTPLAFALVVAAAMMILPMLSMPSLQARLAVAPPVERTDFIGAVAALLWLGTMGTGVCIWAFVRLVQSHGPLFAGMTTYVVPVIALSWGFLDKEQITTRQIMAIAGILSMVALVQVPKKSAGEIAKNAEIAVADT